MDPTPHHNRMNSEPRVNAPPQPHDWVGQGLPRESARRFVAGRGRYTDDLRVPGLLHAAFLRSPWASARWSGLDLSAASAAVFAELPPDPSWCRQVERERERER